MKHQSSPCGEPETPLERKEAVPQKVFHRTGHFSLLASIGILLVQLNSVVASSRQSQPQNIQHNERRLQPGDGFNLTLPDIRFEDNVLSADLIIDLRRVTCRALVIDTMEFYLQPPFGSGIPLYLALRDISITCESDYEYQFLFANGGGSAEFDAHQSNIESQLVFTSPNLFEHPPNDVWFNECTSNVVLDRLDIQAETSGLVSQALGISEPLILPVLENEIGATLCDQIRALDTELAEFLLQFTEQWEPYWQGTSIPYEALDPATVPADALDLQQPADTDLGKLLDFVIAEGSDWLSSDSSGTADAWDISDLLTSDMGDPFSDLLQQSSFETSTVLGMLHMSFDRIETIGFDSAIEEIYPIEIVDSFLLRTGVVISNLTVNIDFTIALRPLNGTSVTKYTSNVSFPVERLDASASLLVLTSESTLGALQLGSLLDSKGLIGCISSGFDRLEVVRVQIDEFVLSESSSFSTSTGWITNILESNLTTDALSSALEGVTSGDCSEVPEFEGTVDLRDLLLSPALSKEYGGSGTEPYGNIGPLFKEYIDESLLTVDEMGRIELLKTLMTAIGQNDSTDDGVLRLDYDFDIDEDLTLGNSRIGLELSLSKLEVQNLAVIASPVTILDPILGQAHRTKNSIVIGKEEAPLKLSARLVFGLSVDDSEMRNVVDISLSFWKLDVSTVLILRMAEKYLMEFPLKSLFDINCLLSLLHTPELDSRGVRLPSVEASLSLEELQILLQGFRLEIDCISCTTEIEELSAKLREPSGGNLATSAVNNFISLLLGFAEDDDSFAQLQIDRYLVEAAQQCDFRDEYDPNFRGIFYEYFATSSESSISSFRALLVMLGVIGGIVLFTVVVMKLLSLVALRRHRLWLKNLPRPQLLAVYTSQQANEVRSRQLDLKSSSLVCSSHVPGPIRLLVPVVLLGNIALFLSGHFSQGGSVMIFIQFAGKKFQIDNFYDFSIFQSALDLWKAGGKELAVLIFLFSVIWPYTKIVITLVLWVAPPRLVSIRRRGSMLIWLDILGKWSMVDVFVMIVTIVAFRITIQSPEGLLEPDFYRIDLVISPMWGLYANMTAQIVTQLSSHLIIYFHRKDLIAGRAASTKSEHARGSNDSKDRSTVGSRELEGDQECALRECHFFRPHRGQHEPLMFRKSASVLFVGGAVALVALLMTGHLLPSISFEELGLVGIVIEFGQSFKGSGREYSIANIVQLLLDQGRFLGSFPDSLGHFSIVALLFSTTLLFPCILTALVLFQFWLPLNRALRGRFSAITETFLAWQYVDVYLLSVAVASWQVGDISYYFLNPYCENLEGNFSELAWYGILKKEDAQCFELRSDIEPAIYVLIAAVILLSMFTSIVENARRQLEYQPEVLAATDGVLDQEVQMETDDLRARIQPVPILFTDRFRWLLQGVEK